MWIRFEEKQPKQDKDLYYFFDVVGVHSGRYYGGDTFQGRRGFLNGDVTHWQYDKGQGKPAEPK